MRDQWLFKADLALLHHPQMCLEVTNIGISNLNPKVLVIFIVVGKG